MSHLEPHPSLPARPPQSSYAAPPRHNTSGQGSYPGASAAYGAFTPRSVVSRGPSSAVPAHAPVMTSQAPYNAGGYQPNLHSSSNAYYPPQQPGYGTSTPPVHAAPFQPPAMASRGYGTAGGYNPEEEAQIAQWQSAYTSKDDANTKKGGQGGNYNANARDGTPDHEDGGNGDGANKASRKTVVRQGGGKSWEDSSLLEWDPLHPRLFVGNLAGEVTDDSLLKAFSKYPSVSKARVIRDKKTTKSKSFGFVSFSNTDDYFRAAKEMQGKYIGSHPVRITRANTEIKATTKREDKHGKHGKKNNKNNKQGGDSGNNGTVISGAPTYNYNGIQKHKGKNGGPRLLG